MVKEYKTFEFELAFDMSKEDRDALISELMSMHMLAGSTPAFIRKLTDKYGEGPVLIGAYMQRMLDSDKEHFDAGGTFPAVERPKINQRVLDVISDLGLSMVDCLRIDGDVRSESDVESIVDKYDGESFFAGLSYGIKSIHIINKFDMSLFGLDDSDIAQLNLNMISTINISGSPEEFAAKIVKVYDNKALMVGMMLSRLLGIASTLTAEMLMKEPPFNSKGYPVPEEVLSDGNHD